MKNKSKRPSILKETNSDRLERIKYHFSTSTRVIPNKKIKSRAQRKTQDRKDFDI